MVSGSLFQLPAEFEYLVYIAGQPTGHADQLGLFELVETVFDIRVVVIENAAGPAFHLKRDAEHGFYPARIHFLIPAVNYLRAVFAKGAENQGHTGFKRVR